MSAHFEPDEINIEGFERFLRAIKSQRPPVGRVGILGQKDSRKDSNSNAAIGAAHEYGSPARGLPQRSFLRVPLTNNLDKELEKTGMMGDAELKEVMRTQSLKPWLVKVCKVAENVVRDSFKTGGDGKWPKVSKDWWDRKKVKQILVETTQLRESITSDVKDK